MFETTNQSIFMIYITIFGYNDPIPKLVMYRSNMVDLSISARPRCRSPSQVPGKVVGIATAAGKSAKYGKIWETYGKPWKNMENMGNTWNILDNRGKYGKIHCKLQNQL